MMSTKVGLLDLHWRIASRCSWLRGDIGLFIVFVSLPAIAVVTRRCRADIRPATRDGVVQTTSTTTPDDNTRNHSLGDTFAAGASFLSPGSIDGPNSFVNLLSRSVGHADSYAFGFYHVCISFLHLALSTFVHLFVFEPQLSRKNDDMRLCNHSNFLRRIHQVSYLSTRSYTYTIAPSDGSLHDAY